jgi:hypothetical protein
MPINDVHRQLDLLLSRLFYTPKEVKKNEKSVQDLHAHGTHFDRGIFRGRTWTSR